MLKIAREQEERFGGQLMCWWRGEGAAQVLAWHDDGILLERAQGEGSLAQLVRDGDDEQATQILCRAIAALHAPRAAPLPELILLQEWFSSLWPAAQAHGGMLRLSATAAAELLSSPREESVLHGDIHHDNVLDFGERGWLAIDPKRLYGERGFDYANIFCNPNYGIATDPAIFQRRVEQVCRLAGLERRRLLQWITAGRGSPPLVYGRRAGGGYRLPRGRTGGARIGSPAAGRRFRVHPASNRARLKGVAGSVPARRLHCAPSHGICRNPGTSPAPAARAC